MRAVESCLHFNLSPRTNVLTVVPCTSKEKRTLQNVKVRRRERPAKSGVTLSIKAIDKDPFTPPQAIMGSQLLKILLSKNRLIYTAMPRAMRTIKILPKIRTILSGKLLFASSRPIRKKMRELERKAMTSQNPVNLAYVILDSPIFLLYVSNKSPAVIIAITPER